jgi:nitroreductase
VKKERTISTDYMIHPLLVERRSPRAFAADMIEPEKLQRIFEAARWAPSSSNEQPWRFIVGIKGNGPTYDKIFSALSERNRNWAQSAPVLAIGVAKKTLSHNGNPNRFHQYDTGQAVAYLTMQAMAEGVFIHQMGSYSAAQARELFNIPDDFEPMAALVLGYLGDPTILPEDLRERETGPRRRRPLAETVFGDTWGQTLDLLE